MQRIAVVEGGAYFHDFSLTDPKVNGLIAKRLYLRELQASDVDDIDVLLVMSCLNPDLLQQKKAIITGFKGRGKKLVILARNYVQEWYPDIVFTDTAVNFWWWLQAGADSGISVVAKHHPIFNYMDEEAVKWHYHGMFSVPENGCDGSVSIVKAREGGSILYEQADGTLITTLDPDFHHGSFFMPGASLFWYGLLNYLYHSN